CMQALGFPFTF
nr:immunoglobulin light chain junction region [Macaca mulatta]